MISAEIIADSLSPKGHRCTSFVLNFPRIVLAEYNTHKMLSRNSASSRAVPFNKMLEKVNSDPFIPIRWMKDHKGMQGNEYFHAFDEEGLRSNWLRARDTAVLQAQTLSEKGLTKQIVNRLLEPFMWHTIITTATEWENFFALRAHEAAEIHIQELAHEMLEIYNNSKPKELKPGEWHIPFGDKFDQDRLHNMVCEDKPTVHNYDQQINNLKIKIAVARCARISYFNFEGKDDYHADVELYNNLSNMGHWSPFEHLSKVMSSQEHKLHSHQYLLHDVDDRIRKDAAKGVTDIIPISDIVDYVNQGYHVIEHGWSGNFRGFIQLRKTFSNENKIDPRVN